MTGQAKIPGICDYVNYLVDNSCKFLIFAHHTEILDSIEEVIINDKISYIRIDGKVPVEKRQDVVNKFQNDEDCLVAILSITACATGLTLTKASTVVFAELHFTPSIMIQAEDRAHRIGQESGCVNIHYLFGADTLDLLLFRKLNEKQNIVSTTLDNKSKDLNVTKIKEQVGDFINMNGKQISVDDRKNITQIVDKSNTTIKTFLSSKSQLQDKDKNQDKNNNIENNTKEKNIIKDNNITNDSNDNNIKYDDNKINVDEVNKFNEKINTNTNNIDKDDIIKNLNLHESNRRRKVDYINTNQETLDNTNDIQKIEVDEIDKNNDDNNVKKEKKKKKKKKKKEKKEKSKNKKKRNKSMDNIKEEKNDEKKENEDENNINNFFEKENNDKIIIEDENKEENIFGEEQINYEKLNEEKVMSDIFDFNKDFNK